jgi:hypothetical protein
LKRPGRRGGASRRLTPARSRRASLSQPPDRPLHGRRHCARVVSAVAVARRVGPSRLRLGELPSPSRRAGDPQPLVNWIVPGYATSRPCFSESGSATRTNCKLNSIFESVIFNTLGRCFSESDFPRLRRTVRVSWSDLSDARPAGHRRHGRWPPQPGRVTVLTGTRRAVTFTDSLSRTRLPARGTPGPGPGPGTPAAVTVTADRAGGGRESVERHGHYRPFFKLSTHQ